MKIEFLSPVAQSLTANGCGYRNDSCYGSGVVSFEEILKFEVFELSNIDILETCRKLYNLKMDLRKKKLAVKYVLDSFQDYFKTNILYALWLSSYDGVKLLYDGENEVTKYKLNKNILIASDLDKDGVLFVSDKIFIPEY